MGVTLSDIALIIVTFFLPPVGAFLVAGCGCDLLINILLTLLGYIPGHLHAFWLIYRKMNAEEQYGRGGYRYVGSGNYEPTQAQGLPPPGANYGATGGR